MNKNLSLLLSIFCLLSFSYAPAEERKLKLGALLPLSGDLAFYGEEIKNGMILAAEHAENTPELYFEDVPFSGAKIVTAFNSLVTNTGIDALAGNFSNVSMLSLAPRINRFKIPSFHSAVMDKDLIAASDWIFSTNVRARDEAIQVSQYAINTLHSKKAAIISVQTNFGQGYREAFIEAYQKIGGSIVADEPHALSDLPDYKSQITRVLHAKPEVIFLASFGPYLGTLVKQLRQAGATQPILSVYETEDSSVVQSAGTTLEGIKYFVTYQYEEDFFKLYTARFQHTPTTFALNAYDAVTLLTKAFHSCAFDKRCVQKYLYATKDYLGVSGRLSINADGSAQKSFSLHTFSSGVFKTVP